MRRGGGQDGFSLMIWRKPKKAWEWLLLASPTVASLFALWIARRTWPPIPPLDIGNGRSVVNIGAILQREASVTMNTIVVCSLPVAIFLTRGIRDMQVSQRVCAVIFLVVVLSCVNAAIAFAGCAVGAAF
jgi:hypothetical protein